VLQLDDNLDLFDYSLPNDPALNELIEGACRSAKAVRTACRTEARRAKSEAVLAEILPAEIAQGEAWHVISPGDVDALSFLAHLLKAAGPMDYVAFSTWCMAVDDVDRFADWLAVGAIRRMDAYVGEIFPGSYAKEYAALCDTVRCCGGRVAVFRNHSKTFLCRSGERAWVIESSANINTNPRSENTVITADTGLYRHHKAWFDAIHSFERNFDDWRPAP
jgi:hypothetical protein